MKLLKRRQAIIDVIETADFIAQDNLDVANKFIDAFESTLEKIRLTPKIGTLKQVKNLPNLRMWFVENFPKNLIFYTASDDEIEIIRVIHASRDYTQFFD